jgi:hypothetical protein
MKEKNDILRDIPIPRELLDALEASAHVVKITEDSKVWSLIYRLWLKNGDSDALSYSV